MKSIDCILIGYNEMDFCVYEKRIREMGENSGAYRDLNLNFIMYNNQPYHASEIFNLFYLNNYSGDTLVKPLNLLDSISTTIAYLGSYLHKRGFSFDYINSFQDEKIKLKQLLTENNILAVAVTTTLYLSPLPIIEIIHFIKKYNRSAKIIVGGPFVSTQVQSLTGRQLEYLYKYTIGADFYVINSQGESTLVKLLQALKNNAPVGDIDNIYFKTHTGYSSTPLRDENNKLSENMVDWGLFSRRVGEVVNIRTAISCPFSCAFCRYPGHAGAYQTNDVESIARELNTLNKMDSLRSIYFIDDTFNVPPERFKKILKMMIKNQYKFKWHSYFRCQFADREMVELMKESKCEGVYLGLESGNNSILKNMNKAASIEKYRQGIELLKEFELVTFGSFIIGFPGETHETVRDTINFIEEIQLDFYRAHPWYYEPIAPVWEQRNKYNIQGESFEWNHATMNSKTATDIVDELFLSSKKSIWVPQYNFNFDSIWHILHKGISLDNIKKFLNSFNNGIRERISNPGQKEVSFEVLNQLTESFQSNKCSTDFFDKRKNKIDRNRLEFDF